MLWDGSWKVRGVSYGAGNIDVESLEMLVNGMKHESKHHSSTGFITELTFYNVKLYTCCMAQGVTMVCSLESFSSHITSVQFVSKII